MEIYRIFVIPFILNVFNYTKGYVLNVEICLKLSYNLDWDFEGSLERYHYCHALAQTLEGVEQVIYKMQIRDHMRDAWLNLLNKKGNSYASTKLSMAKSRGMISEETSDVWSDLIQSNKKKTKRTTKGRLAVTECNKKSSENGKYALIQDDKWVIALIIGGTVTYLAIGLIVMLIHHLRTNVASDDEYLQYHSEYPISSTKRFIMLSE